MMTRRSFLGTFLAMSVAAAAVLSLAPHVPSLAATPAGKPEDTIRAFYDVLLATMKDAKSLGFAGRRDRLTPAMTRAFDLPEMTRLAVGPRWSGLTPQEQSDLVSAFSGYSVAVYANRFNDYSGEKFEVEPNPAPSNGGVIVHTKLIKSNGEPIELDYFMKPADGAWKIVDVYLSGTVSELATRRSEFSSVLSRGGAAALVDALRRKSTEQQPG